jgi:predicted Fe-S protein YdhL (DUF1289 family)
MDTGSSRVMKPPTTTGDATTPALTPSLTPCVGVCRLDDRGLCVGCRRSLGEIATWRDLPDSERIRFMRDVLPARKPR